MNIERRATKIYLRSLAPRVAINSINLCQLPSPWREVLICACVDRKEGYKGIDYLAEYYNIHIDYWTFVRRLKEALDMFRTAKLAKDCQ